MNRLITLLLSICLLSACANMTFKGMYEMATFDLFALEPAQLSIAVRTDKALEIEQGNVVINLSFVSDDETLYIQEKLLPSVTQTRAISGALANGLEPHEQITLFNLTAEDANTMKESLMQAKDYKDNGRKGTGAFGISIENVCFEEERLLDADIDILVQKSTADDFFMFLENLNLRELTNTKSENKEAMDKLFCNP